MEYVSVIAASEVSEAVAALYSRISTELRSDVVGAIRAAIEREGSALARDILEALLENEQISRSEGVPLCQDTGLAVAFVSIGASVIVEGATVEQAVNEGVRAAVSAHPLRASMVGDPLARENTGDNTPAIIHLGQTEGDGVTIHLLAKGGGAENMSRVYMLTPAEGREGVLRAVVTTVREAGANACPPVIVGVGLGGDFERAPLLAKRALLRDLREPNPDAELAALELEALNRVNELGIGPQGLGGRATALAVSIERAPCHIASLPVAVNVECHSHRHGSVTLHGKRRRLAST
ncbi:MAG: fumarate hydratase [Planctomycetota bacterium]|jgi:fumarate hydratase subunit alpha